jgi:uncharacterized RDD family membrane protein YckC
MSTNYTPGAPTTLFCSKCGGTVSATDAFCPNCSAPQHHAVVPAQVAVPATVRTYAGFWIRFAAIFIDAIVVGVIMSPVSMLTSLFFGTLPGRRPEVAIPALMSVVGLAFSLSLVVNWLYEALMTSSSKQATVGKLVFGLIVTDTQGARLSFLHATGRHFAKFLSSITLAIGYIMAAFTERKQALHDFIAGTYVLKGKPTSSL